MKFSDIFDENVGIALDRQSQLDDLIGAWDWAFNMDTLTLTFTKRGLFAKERSSEVQFLGTESQRHGTWLWSWSTASPRVPDTALIAGKALRELGIRREVHQLSEPQHSLDMLDGHAASMIAVGLTSAAAYYRARFAGGARFLLITDDSFKTEVESPAERIVTFFPRVLRMADVTDQHRALAAYAHKYGFVLDSDGGRLTADSPDGAHRIEASFDEKRKLVDLQLREL